MAAAGAAMGFGKKAALAAAGLFSGVGGAVAYKLDQVNHIISRIRIRVLMCRRCKLSCPCTLPTSPGHTVVTLTPLTTPASGADTRCVFTKILAA